MISLLCECVCVLLKITRTSFQENNGKTFILLLFLSFSLFVENPNKSSLYFVILCHLFGALYCCCVCVCVCSRWGEDQHGNEQHLKCKMSNNNNSTHHIQNISGSCSYQNYVCLIYFAIRKNVNISYYTNSQPKNCMSLNIPFGRYINIHKMLFMSFLLERYSFSTSSLECYIKLSLSCAARQNRNKQTERNTYVDSKQMK